MNNHHIKNHQNWLFYDLRRKIYQFLIDLFQIKEVSSYQNQKCYIVTYLQCKSILSGTII
ncbi:hypothetical protein DMC31_01500 [Vibrio parahaemolyticus]|nr:hypothetical protein [Vibrio parahaemolyticus]EGQ9514859.1 hypothetical protein [Vibrio parahaemolyticus]EGR2284364.1 hypothetical protein [Vibrio parahaemolyticus]EGR3391590.1 hypothetical protein [Vibrio parahaemolyticus]OUJ63045.1 hypothetical protein BTO03_02950 [Vibrio parahaemolyticus]